MAGAGLINHEYSLPGAGTPLALLDAACRLGGRGGGAKLGRKLTGGSSRFDVDEEDGGAIVGAAIRLAVAGASVTAAVVAGAAVDVVGKSSFSSKRRFSRRCPAGS